MSALFSGGSAPKESFHPPIHQHIQLACVGATNVDLSGAMPAIVLLNCFH